MRVAQHHPQTIYADTMDSQQQKIPRPTSLSIQLPRAQPLLPAMSYNRQLSPGGRRLTNPGRTSDSLTDGYRYERHNSYASPRSSTGVIPISTQTFVNIPPPSNTRPSTDQRVDAYSGRPLDRPADSYSGRPRRNSLIDSQRDSTTTVNTVPSRSRPTVVQGDYARPTSPLKNSREKEYYVQPATTKEPRKTEHRKVYSVNDGSANLVADVDVPAGGERHHKRRESAGTERGGYRGPGMERDTRGRRGYHLNGSSVSKSKEKSIDDDDAYSYTDPASMYRDTEPRWREREVRPRRGSVDRGGASRERPVSLVEPNFDPRKSNKEIGPPPSTRGWDKLNDNLGRTRSVRERSRDVPQSPNRARVPQSPTRARVPQSPTRGRYAEAGAYGDPGDRYYVPPRTSSNDRRNTAVHQDRPVERYEQNEYDERREPRRHERRNSVTRLPDRSVERRGFGIRSDSQDRYGRGSDESFDRQQNKYRDSGYAVVEPHRRDTAPEVNYQEERRLEQEKRDRAIPDRNPNEERERQWEREAREKEQQRRRDEERNYNREQDRERDQRREQRDRDYEMDRERERERERMMQPQPPLEREPERHHHRHESNRDPREYDREYNRKESGPRESGESVAQSGLSTAAAGGLAGAAAAFGTNKMMNRHDDREKERGDRDQDRRLERPLREFERDRRSPRLQEVRSDEGLPYQQEQRDQRDQRDPFRTPAEPDGRGLGFAFENPPEPPKSAPPMRDRPEPPAVNRERVAERDFEREHEDKSVEMAQPALDPDEDYRRRMEQVQRELGRAPDDRSSDSDPDRERRRREREQRQRERLDARNGDVASITSSFNDDPRYRPENVPLPHGSRSFETDSVDGGTNTTASTVSGHPGLKRKPSILDQPMMSEPAQIIDNSMSERRENRVRIVDPPTEEEQRKPKGILKKPTQKFPENPNAVREGVAPLKDVRSRRTGIIGCVWSTDVSQATKKGIPPGARWTKIDRRLVNPEALEEAKERFEERLDCVIVLRVLTKEEIQKLADRTTKIRGKHYHSLNASNEDMDGSTAGEDHHGHDRA